MLKKDFRSRIVVIVLTVVMVSGLVNGLAVMWNFNNISKAELHDRVKIESDIISQNLATSVLFDDSSTATEILQTFKADPAVLLVTLQVKDQDVFASYKSPQFDTLADDIFTLVEPVQFEGEKVGSLTLVVSNFEVSEQNFASAVFVILSLALIFLLAIGLTSPLIRSLLVPLMNLYRISEKIAETRDYSLRANITSKDEVGQLSEMFNHMVEQIEHRDDMLEQQVGQRTLELEKLAEEFRFRAFHDNLTGLPNRALLNERFTLSVERAKRDGNRFACLLLDLDDFKAINDTRGHEIGDELLVDVAERLKDTVRAQDLVCRLGGDEFIIILDGINVLKDVTHIANKILAELSREFAVRGERVRTAVSIGGAVFPDHGTDMSTIKRHADVAMYKAKEEGKNRFCLFTEGMQEEVKYRLMIQNDLKPGLKEHQFEVYLQPKVDPLTSDLVGCEALVRWNHPTEGFLTPNKFVPYAEEMGMIEEIDYFVIEQACEFILTWEEILSRPIPIAFNLSGRHFRDYKIVEVIQAALDRSGVDPARLEVEITEAVLINDPHTAQKVVCALREIGLGISLDDFGTGYSSLSYLRTFPIDTVKLDRSFIANVHCSEQDHKLIKGIISLAKGLDLRLVAEGVETAEQVHTLIEMGCTAMQGYFFLPPASNTEFLHWYFKTVSIRRGRETRSLPLKH